MCVLLFIASVAAKDFCHLAPWGDWSECDTTGFSGNPEQWGDKCPGHRNRRMIPDECHYVQGQDCLVDCMSGTTTFPTTGSPDCYRASGEHTLCVDSNGQPCFGDCVDPVSLV